ncbi:MAG: SagB/ThcOx family dehydrogenase, partial [Chloroflexi bacterium]|nr:SagB/ThcOx family dehydrogenase [Chloroflexota bacterium]
MKIWQLMWLVIFATIIGLSIPGCSSTVSKESPPQGSTSAAAPPSQPAPVSSSATGPAVQPVTGVDGNFKLPEPRLKSDVSLEEALLARRSIRQYANAPLSLNDVSQLLWAAQGITDSSGKRTAPSAMATYPLEIYLVAGNVENLAAGIYLYVPAGHELKKIKDGDVRKDLSQMPSAQNGAVDIVIAGNLDKF